MENRILVQGDGKKKKERDDLTTDLIAWNEPWFRLWLRSWSDIGYIDMDCLFFFDVVSLPASSLYLQIFCPRMRRESSSMEQLHRFFLSFFFCPEELIFLELNNNIGCSKVVLLLSRIYVIFSYEQKYLLNEHDVSITL